MPVIRKRVEVPSTVGQGAAVSRPQGVASPGQPRGLAVTNVAGLADQMAQNMARAAGEYSRAMAVTAEEEGLALAKAAVFNTDEMGMPILPPDIKDRMGKIAARAYTGAIEERYAHQMTTALRAQIADAQSANLYDMDGFLADAQGRIDQMREIVPPHMQGAFQQISTGLLADGGAQIGRRQGQIAIDEARAMAPMTVDDITKTAIDNINAGYADRATQLVDDAFEMIDKYGPEIMPLDKKREAKRDVVARTGIARIKKDFDLGEADSATIRALIADLNLGQNEELLKYFEYDGFDMDAREIARAAAGQLGVFLGEANSRDAAKRERTEKQANLDLIFGGGSKDTEKNKSLMDDGLSMALKIPRADGKGYRAITMGDWATMDPKQRVQAVALMKSAGYTSASVDQFFRAVMRGDDPDALVLGFELYRDLREGMNAQGETGMDLTADLPQKVKEIYGMAEILHGSGDPGQESIMEAFEMWNVLKTEGDWSDEQWAKALEREGAWTRGVGRPTADNWQNNLDAYLEDEIFDGVSSSPAERAEARELFKTYYRAGSGLTSVENVTEMVRQSMEGRWMDSTYMNQRSSYAPEKWYPEPPAGGILEALKKGDRAVNDALFDFLGIPKGQGIWSLGLSENGVFEDNLTRARANTFDIVAHRQIAEIIDNADPVLRDRFKIENDIYVGGRDYILKPASKGTPPVYHVMMLDDNGTPHTVGTLDVREAYEDFTRIDVSYRSRQEALLSRKGKMLTDEFGPAGIDGLIAQELAKDPTRDPWDIIEEYWGQTMGEMWDQSGGTGGDK